MLPFYHHFTWKHNRSALSQYKTEHISYKLNNQNQDNPTCLLCGREDETVSRFMLRCPVLDNVRNPVIDNIFISTCNQVYSPTNTPDSFLQQILDCSRAETIQRDHDSMRFNYTYLGSIIFYFDSCQSSGSLRHFIQKLCQN